MTDELAYAIAVSVSSGAAGGAIGALVALLMRDRQDARRPARRRAERRRPHVDVPPAHPVPEVVALPARPERPALGPASHTRLEIAARDWFDRGGPR